MAVETTGHLCAARGQKRGQAATSSRGPGLRWLGPPRPSIFLSAALLPCTRLPLSHLCSFPASQPGASRLSSVRSLQPRQRGDGRRGKRLAASRLPTPWTGGRVSRPLSVPAPLRALPPVHLGDGALLGWPGRGSEQPLLSLLGSRVFFLEWRRLRYGRANPYVFFFP